jgi:hypothetical protein
MTIQVHIQGCPERMIVCDVKGCNAILPLRDYDRHIMNETYVQLLSLPEDPSTRPERSVFAPVLRLHGPLPIPRA